MNWKLLELGLPWKFVKIKQWVQVILGFSLYGDFDYSFNLITCNGAIEFTYIFCFLILTDNMYLEIYLFLLDFSSFLEYIFWKYSLMMFWISLESVLISSSYLVWLIGVFSLFIFASLARSLSISLISLFQRTKTLIDIGYCSFNPCIIIFFHGLYYFLPSFCLGLSSCLSGASRCVVVLFI